MSNQRESQQTNIINKMCASLLGKILLSDPNLSLSVKKDILLSLWILKMVTGLFHTLVAS